MRLCKVISGTMLLFALLLVSAPAIAQNEIPSSATIDQWLHGPETHLPGWDVHVQSPVLTFQLRYAVAIRGRADIARAHLTGHEVHVFIRVADSKGWLPIPRHSSLGKLPNKADLTVIEDFFAKPGDYRVGFIVYDAVAKTHGVWFKRVHVPENDLPLAYSHSEEVEFIDPEGPLLPHETPLPERIENRHPLRIDVVVNLTERVELELSEGNSLSHRGRRAGESHPPDWLLDRPQQDVVSESLLSVAEALAAFQPDGCVRVSAFDAIRAKTYLDRAAFFNAAKVLQDLRRSRNVAAVDQRTLALRLKAADFFRSFVQKIVDDRSGCGVSDQHAQRAVIVVSDELVFPKEEPLRSVEPNTDNTRFYFLRLAIPDLATQFRFDYSSGTRIPMAGARFDEVTRLLEDLHVHRFDIAQPKDFQKVLPELTHELKEK